jgi:hypothetical protein
MSWFKKDKPKEPDYAIKVERSRIDRHSFTSIIYRKNAPFSNAGMLFGYRTAELAEKAALDWVQDDLNMKNGWTTKVYIEGWFIATDHTKHMLSTERSKS